MDFSSKTLEPKSPAFSWIGLLLTLSVFISATISFYMFDSHSQKDLAMIFFYSLAFLSPLAIFVNILSLRRNQLGSLGHKLAVFCLVFSIATSIGIFFGLYGLLSTELDIIRF